MFTPPLFTFESADPDCVNSVYLCIRFHKYFIAELQMQQAFLRAEEADEQRTPALKDGDTETLRLSH